MSRLLPIQPDLEHLKNEAKALLKSHHRGDTTVCGLLRRLRRFAGATDADILAAPLTLTEAQFALAMEYGFPGWDELRRTVLRGRPVDGAMEPPRAQALRLPDPPAGRWANVFASAYQITLTSCGVPCDYDTIAGDTGLAFILQADGQHTPYGAQVKELDLGWWPLDEWGAMLRLDFLGRAHGIPMRRLPTHVDEYKADVAAHFGRHHRPSILESFEAGRPVVAAGRDVCVVTGIDDGTPPLLGQLACSDQRNVSRLNQYPWVVVVPCDMVEAVDRVMADAEALEFAVALHHDRFRRYHSGAQLAPHLSGGKQSFDLWASVLRDGERCGPHFYSGNVAGCMSRNRSSAPPYLRAMASRHGAAVAGPLRTAAELYEEVLAALGKADTSKEAFVSAAGRCDLADKVDAMAALEAKAVVQLESAVKAMG